jgi:hypothetical protein
MNRIKVNLATGETAEHDDYRPEPYTEPRVIPQSVSRKQFICTRPMSDCV